MDGVFIGERGKIDSVEASLIEAKKVMLVLLGGRSVGRAEKFEIADNAGENIPDRSGSLVGKLREEVKERGGGDVRSLREEHAVDEKAELLLKGEISKMIELVTEL